MKLRMTTTSSKKANTLLAIVFAILTTIAMFAQTGAKVVLPEPCVIDRVHLVDDIKFLSSDELSGREAGTPGGAAAQKYVLKRFREAGLKRIGAEYMQEFSFKTRSDQTVEGVNIIGIAEGIASPGKFIVVTAHYDHLGVREGEIYNGADDNASGTAALFAIAKYFNHHRPNHSIIFVAFDAEEKGLQGARYFVKNLPVRKESILLNINMDMISHNDKNELFVAGTFHYPFLKKYVEAIQKAAPVKLLFGHDSPELKRDDWTSQSDHGAFHNEKIPFIYFGVEDHIDYHKPTDEFQNINQKFYVNSVETILSVVEFIDKHFKPEQQ